VTYALRHGLFLAALFLHADACRGASEEGIPPRKRILSVASSLIGTREASGRNDGPVVEIILASTGNAKGDPYCAAFCYWVYFQSGLGALVPRSAWSPDWVARPTWTREAGGATPRPGDPFGIYFTSKGRVAHVGLVRQWGRQSIVTVEANTSPEAVAGSAADRDGGGIWSKRRLIRQIHASRNWLGD
jgi:cell wall-associated NlpC family hydrolase